MTARILEPNEYHRLAGTEADGVWPHLTEEAKVVVIEDAGEIVGCQILQPVLHAECVWVRPDHRGRGVVQQLWAAVQRAAVVHFGVKAVVGSAVDDRMRAVLRHLGAVRVAGDLFTVPVKG
jgi:ribosomal protein S18 acetylase RimI-like enzyme